MSVQIWITRTNKEFRTKKKKTAKNAEAIQPDRFMETSLLLSYL